MRVLIAVVILGLAGCTTISEDARKVHVHAQYSNLLGDCERLGRLSVDVPVLVGSGYTEAEYKLRKLAYTKYAADTVVITNVDYTYFSVRMQGTAFICD